MTTPSYPVPDDGDRFADSAVDADARSAGRAREHFAVAARSRRARRHPVQRHPARRQRSPGQRAEFAYVKRGGTGAIDVEAVRNRAAHTLTVTIADQGSWREPDPANRATSAPRHPLMRALADEVTIDTSALGTTVCLRFDNVPALQRADVSV